MLLDMPVIAVAMVWGRLRSVMTLPKKVAVAIIRRIFAAVRADSLAIGMISFTPIFLYTNMLTTRPYIMATAEASVAVKIPE